MASKARLGKERAKEREKEKREQRERKLGMANIVDQLAVQRQDKTGANDLIRPHGRMYGDVCREILDNLSKVALSAYAETASQRGDIQMQRAQTIVNATTAPND